MPSDSRHDRVSSKRKSRHGSEDFKPRKKQHRPSSVDEDFQFEAYGSGEDEIPNKSSNKSKGKSAPRNEKEYPSVNELKKRIRDVKRLLNKKDLPADARVLQERALAGYEQDLEEELARRERSQMIKKYHFVRFLDRKTATKQLNRLLRREKQQDLDAKEKARLTQKIHAARVNLSYTIYYPLTEKYLSLYPKSKGKSEEAGADSASESDSKKQQNNDSDDKPPLWPVVEKCMEEGSLDLLREGKLNIGADGQSIPASSSKKSTAATESEKTKIKKDHKERKEPKDVPEKEKCSSRHAESNAKREKPGRKDYGRERSKVHDVPAEPDGNDSDGGFFEE